MLARPWSLVAVTLLASLSLVFSAGKAAAADAPAGLPETVSFYNDIRPIFQQHCQGCHQPAKAEGGILMTSHALLLKAGESGEVGITPGNAAKSLIYTVISGAEPSMPKGKDPLAPRDVQLVERWIAQGAKDDSPASTAPPIDMEHPPVYSAAPVITALDYSPDGSLLAVSGYHEVLLHKADGSGLAGRLVGLSERISTAAFSPDGKRLAVLGGSPGRFGELQVWDVAEKKLTLSLTHGFDTLYGGSWSPDGKKIAFGAGDNTLRAIDAETGKQVLFQGAHNDLVLDSVFSTAGTHLISVSRDMSMKLTEVATERFVDNITSITPGALKGGLMAVTRHPAKDELLAGGSDGTPRLYKMIRTQARVIGDDFNLLRAYPAIGGRIYGVRFNADGSLIAAASSDNGRGVVRVFQYADAALKADCEGQKGPVYAVAFAPNGSAIASAGFDGVVRLNDPNTGKLIREFTPVDVPAAAP